MAKRTLAEIRKDFKALESKGTKLDRSSTHETGAVLKDLFAMFEEVDELGGEGEALAAEMRSFGVNLLMALDAPDTGKTLLSKILDRTVERNERDSAMLASLPRRR